MMNFFRMILVSGAVVALAIQGAAQNQHANQARGFDPNGVYSTKDIDNINVFNGALALAIPVGQTYKVGANLSYGLNLVYNSNLWTHKEVCSQEIATSGNVYGTWVYTAPSDTIGSFDVYDRFVPNQTDPISRPKGDGCWTVAVPNPSTNAGMGWQLLLGKLFPPRSTGDDLIDPHPLKTENELWVYETPDGSEHAFYPTLHATDRPGSANVSYTRDGSYLRMKQTGSLRQIEFPDGTVHVFSNANSGDVNHWRLVQMHDQFTDAGGLFVNKVDIAYVKDLSGNDVWQLRDSYGRQQKITFEVKVAKYQPVITKVELTAFGSGTATYLFNYETRLIKRAAPHTADEEYKADVTVPFLKGITLPDQSAYSMPVETSYAVSDETGYARLRGVLRGVTLPTGARLEWDYGLYQFSYLSSGRGYQDVSLGVRTRRVIENGLRREWTYTATLEAQPQSSNEGKSCLIDTEKIKPECGVRELVTKVTTPLGHYTKHYFSVYAHPWGQERGQGRSIYDWHISEYGLPLTKKQSVIASDGKPVFLSQQVFASGAAETNPLRSEYVRYETDTIPPENGFGSSVRDINRRVAASRTVFHDDDNDAAGNERFADVVYDNFDGLGHYRTTNSYGNFERGDGTGAQRGQVGDLRIEVTNYNPARGTYAVSIESNTLASVPNPHTAFPESAPWILGTYDTVTAGDYNKRSTNYFYFNSNGQLIRKRIGSALEPAGTGYFVRANDVLVEYEYQRADGTTDGTMTAERHYGGDQKNNLPTTWPLQDVVLLATPEYHVTHEYAFGVLKKSRYVGMPYASVDNDIDARTGLVRASRDLSQNQTDYLYDTSGRVIQIKPRQGSRTDIVYTRLGQPLPVGQLGSSSTAPQVASTGPVVNAFYLNSAGTATLDEERYDYDPLGRLTVETKLMPAGGISRTTLYNQVGWKSSVSEWGTALKKTQYIGYDPFGRPGVIRPPDTAEHDVGLRYKGVREVRRTKLVGTEPFMGSVIERASVTTEVYDRLGRLRSVEEASGHSGGDVTTYYNYDVGNRLIKVRTPAVPVAGAAEVTQARDFVYDNRGYLLSERMPEAGASGNGLITYGGYDTMGNVGTRVDGTRALKFSYDGGSRPTLVEERGPSGSYRELKKFTYYGTNDIANNHYRLGKAYESKRHNYVIHPLSGAEIDVQINEIHAYLGLNGSLSHKTTVLNSAHPTPPTFNQSFIYDDLGNLSSQSYPECFNTTCTSSGMAVPRSVTYGYNRGVLTRVTGGGFNYASSLTYHNNGAMNTVTYGNGVVQTYAKDPNNMQRVASISTTGANANWNSGAYVYDGSGNITKIGSDWYVYDKAGRVVEGTALSAPNRKQGYTYDPFGNLRSITTYQNVTTSGATVESTNNLDVNASTNRINGLSYDASGNILGLPTDNPRPYSYDSLNRQKTAPGKTFIYTAADERVWIIDHSAATWIETLTLRGLNNEVLREYQVFGGDGIGNWQVSKDYIYTSGKLLASESPSGRLFYHPDHLGTPRLITNATAQRVSAHQYFPFGFEATPSGHSGERLRFTGHERDSHFNGHTLDHMHARVYNPHMGRFASVDPGRDADPAMPQSWNMYAYVRNNPLNWTDPTGMGLASWLANKYEAAALSLERAADRLENFAYNNTGSGAGGVVASTLAGSAGDVMRSTADKLRIGKESGTAIGSGAHSTDVAKAISHDVIRGAEIALTVAAPVEGGLRAAFATAPGKAAFYSGGSAARAAAQASGRTTIEMTPGGRMIERLAGNAQNTVTGQLWRFGSQYFARGATGDAAVFLRTPLRPNAVWTTIEQPMMSSRGTFVGTYHVP